MRIKKRIRIIDTDAIFVVSKDYRDAVTEGQHDDPRRGDARADDRKRIAQPQIAKARDERTRPRAGARMGEGESE